MAERRRSQMTRYNAAREEFDVTGAAGAVPDALRAEYSEALSRIIGMMRTHLRAELLGLQLQHRVAAGGSPFHTGSSEAERWYSAQACDLGAMLDVAATLVIAISGATKELTPSMVLDAVAASVDEIDG